MTSSSRTSPTTSPRWRAAVHDKLSGKFLVRLQFSAPDLRDAEAKAIAQVAFLLRADPSTLDVTTLTEILRRNNS